MKIMRTSPFTGQSNTMDLDITMEQIQQYLDGALLQDAFPNLTAAEREFFKTGYTAEDWEMLFGTEEEAA